MAGKSRRSLTGTTKFSVFEPAMNWAGLTVAIGLVGLTLSTMPFGLVIIPVAIWLWRMG